MNIKLLKELLAVQTCTNKEHPMVAWLVDYIVRHIHGATVTVDPHRNVYVTKGQSVPYPYPCVAAHIDTVQPHRPVKIIQHGTRLIGHTIDLSVDNEKQCGIGADDKTGVFVCLELLKRLNHIAAVFFAGEEHCTIGAKAADPAFFQDIGYLIEYDCPSRNMVSYSCGGERLFMNDGDFIKTAHPVLVKHGSVLWQDHPYTDVMTVRKRFPLSCLNLSSGYYNWHASNEFASIPDIGLCLQLSVDLLSELGFKRYPAPMGDLNLIDRGNDPLCPVGYLHVPEALP